MCEGGRILHHFRDGLEEPKNSVVLVGFMAQHTLGRRLVERRPQVKVFGVERDVRAEVHVLNGLSAHADQEDLTNFARATVRGGRVVHVVLVHGEEAASGALAAVLRDVGIHNVTIAARGERLEL